MTGYAKKTERFLAAVLVMMLMFWFPGELAVCASESLAASANSAGSYESVPGLCIAEDTANNIYRPAVVFSMNTSKTSGAGVYTAYYENDAEGAVISVQGYPASYVETIEHKISFWYISEEAAGDASAAAVLYYPVKGEEIHAYYYDSSVSIAGSVTQIKECRTADDESYTLIVDPVPEIAYHPGMLLNGNGELVGILLSDTVAFTEFFSEEIFESGSVSPDSGSPDSGSGGEEDGGNAGGGSQDRGNDGAGSQDRGKDGAGSEGRGNDGIGIYLLLAAVLVCIGIVVGMVFGKKKNTGKKDGGDQIDDTFPSFHLDTPDYPAPAAFDDFRSDSVSPMNPPGDGNKKKLFLACSGGYMDGRLYPIGDEPITIGRGNPGQLVICYPGDTPGVSRNHARLYKERGRLMLMDCNSSNGTYVKNVGKIPPMQPRELKVGDVFYIGEKKNRFEIKL